MEKDLIILQNSFREYFKYQLNQNNVSPHIIESDTYNNQSIFDKILRLLFYMKLDFRQAVENEHILIPEYISIISTDADFQTEVMNSNQIIKIPIKTFPSTLENNSQLLKHFDNFNAYFFSNSRDGIINKIAINDDLWYYLGPNIILDKELNILYIKLSKYLEGEDSLSRYRIQYHDFIHQRLNKSQSNIPQIKRIYDAAFVFNPIIFQYNNDPLMKILRTKVLPLFFRMNLDVRVYDPTSNYIDKDVLPESELFLEDVQRLSPVILLDNIHTIITPLS